MAVDGDNSWTSSGNSEAAAPVNAEPNRLSRHVRIIERLFITSGVAKHAALAGYFDRTTTNAKHQAFADAVEVWMKSDRRKNDAWRPSIGL